MRIIPAFCFVFLLSIAFIRCSDDGKPATAGQNALATDEATIGVQLWSFRLFPVETAVLKADSSGLRHIETFFGQPVFKDLKDSFGIGLSPEARSRLRSFLAEKGIKMVSAYASAAKDRQEWIKTFELAKDFDLSYITVEPLKEHWDLIDSLGGIYGIKIALHEHARGRSLYWHPDTVIAAMTNRPNIGACADIGHWGRSGLDPVSSLAKLEGRIWGVHLKDINEFNNIDAEDVVVGHGVFDFPAIFAELERQQFRGMITIEREGNWENNVPDIRETVKYYKNERKKLK